MTRATAPAYVAGRVSRLNRVLPATWRMVIQGRGDAWRGDPSDQRRSPRMTLLNGAVSVAMLAFVVSSMLAVGVSLTVGQIVAPLRKGRVVSLALLANFVLMPLGAILVRRLRPLDGPLRRAP